jgi:hypothetical protein
MEPSSSIGLSGDRARGLLGWRELRDRETSESDLGSSVPSPIRARQQRGYRGKLVYRLRRDARVDRVGDRAMRSRLSALPDHDLMGAKIRALRGEARLAAPSRRARAAGVHQVRGRGARLRKGLVQHVQDKLPDRVLVSQKIDLPVMRTEALDPVGRVAAPRGPRSGAPPPCRHDHSALPPARAPQASPVAARPGAVAG